MNIFFTSPSQIKDLIKSGEFWHFVERLAKEDQMVAAGTFSKEE